MCSGGPPPGGVVTSMKGYRPPVSSLRSRKRPCSPIHRTGSTSSRTTSFGGAKVMSELLVYAGRDRAARTRPRRPGRGSCGVGDHAELALHRQVVAYGPVVADPAVDDADHVQVLDRDLLAGGRQAHAHERSLVRAAHDQPERDEVVLGDRRLDLVPEVGERLEHLGGDLEDALVALRGAGRRVV